MRTIQILTILLLFAATVTTSCKKEEPEPVNNPGPSGPTGTTFSYTDLSAAQSTISVGSTTNVTTTATGSNLTYTWSATAGTITGNGSQISYFGCCIGSQKVTCSVSDGSNSQSKDITITVQ